MITVKLFAGNIQQMEIADGFFDGWPNPPSKEGHLRILEQSYKSLVAVDEESNKIVGFINAVSDGVLSAYIPLLEVLPQYRGQGIASRLVEGMLKELGDLYMIDLCCDEELGSFYERFGMIKAQAMIFRNYANQCGTGS